MKAHTAVKFLPIVTENQKVDVSLDGANATIKLSTWNEDLGWCGQKTMTLDAGMLDDLHRVIAAARVRMASQADGDESGTVLRFPAMK
jgi:hypothetical protein